MMHKACVITLIAMLATLFAWLNAATSLAQDTPCVHDQAMKELRGEAVPVIGPLHNLADHTYVVALLDNGVLASWGCFGRDQGGAVLTDTRARGAISNTYRICFMASQSPCKWPKFPLYTVVGVCHQLANRGLYTAGTTVSQARGYGLSSWFYGPYGKTILLPAVWQYRMYNCLENAPGPTASAYRIKMASYSPGEKSKEYLLFQEYLPKLKEAEKRHNKEEQYKLMNQYRREVVSSRLDEAGVTGDAKKKVLGFYDKSVPKIEEQMAARLQNKDMTFEEYQKKMNALLKEVQEGLKKILSKKQYNKFTNAPFDKTLVWEDFTDKPVP